MSRPWDRCTKCVLSRRFPRIEFDAEGVCSFCRDQAFYVAADGEIEKARARVAELLSELPRDSRYDALVCLSGGKDSTYTLMLTVRKYGLRALAFTFDNGFLSDVAFENIRRAVDALGADHLIIRPSSDFMKAVVRTSAMHPIYPPRTLLRISAVCNSCITMVNTTATTIALEKRIPFVVAGFTLGQIPSNAVIYKPNYRFIQESRDKPIAALETHTGMSMDGYFTVREDLLDRPSPWHLNLLCLESIPDDQIEEEIAALGWRRPDDVDGCSSNCRLNAFNNFAHEKAYGYNPYELELSHLVRKGLLSRRQAIRKLRDKAGPQLNVILKELGIRRSELAASTDRKDRKNNG